MNPIPTLDRDIVTSIVKSIGSLGADVERLVERCELAEIWTDPERESLPEHHVWRLFERSGVSMEMPDIGLRVGARFEISDLGTFGLRLRSRLTVLTCLHEYIKTVNRYSSHSKFWLDRNRGGVWFCRQGIDLINVGRNEVEQFTLELMIRIVQLGCGSDWAPRRVLVQHSDVVAYRQFKDHARTEINFDQAMTAIWISDRELSGQVSWQDDDVTARVRKSIQLSLQNDVPSISTIAPQLGYSVRGLQRTLAERQLDWSLLLAQVRLDYSMKLLAGEMPLSSIAQALGYTDQANFGRAFRRWTGTTPKSFREQAAQNVAN